MQAITKQLLKFQDSMCRYFVRKQKPFCTTSNMSVPCSKNYFPLSNCKMTFLHVII